MRAGLSIPSFTSLSRACVFALACGLGLAVTTMVSHANQRPFPIVALSCETNLPLCRAVLRALSELHSAHLYRINPNPIPPNAFDLRLELPKADSANLRWQGGGTGKIVAQQGQDDAKFAQRIIQASPGLLQALERHE